VAGHGCDAFLGTFYAWSLKIIPMADDHVFSFLDVFSFQFAKEILRYQGAAWVGMRFREKPC
ncbi:hypothetical protein, partial [Slackia isoflavoniconvertens]|uniref:hypothetical protein n=1 Tax=Slackia isoflavoniconvertens TaxID=572010 RepID=UPI003AF1CD8A